MAYSICTACGKCESKQEAAGRVGRIPKDKDLKNEPPRLGDKGDEMDGIETEKLFLCPTFWGN